MRYDLSDTEMSLWLYICLVAAIAREQDPALMASVRDKFSRYEQFGWVSDPTAYMAAQDQLAAGQRLLVAWQAFQEAAAAVGAIDLGLAQEAGHDE